MRAEFLQKRGGLVSSTWPVLSMLPVNGISWYCRLRQARLHMACTIGHVSCEWHVCKGLVSSTWPRLGILPVNGMSLGSSSLLGMLHGNGMSAEEGGSVRLVPHGLHWVCFLWMACPGQLISTGHAPCECHVWQLMSTEHAPCEPEEEGGGAWLVPHDLHSCEWHVQA